MFVNFVSLNKIIQEAAKAESRCPIEAEKPRLIRALMPFCTASAVIFMTSKDSACWKKLAKSIDDQDHSTEPSLVPSAVAAVGRMVMAELEKPPEASNPAGL